MISLSYIKADFGRILHKKSLYIYLAILAIGYLILAVTSFRNLNSAGITEVGIEIFNYFPLFIGSFVFVMLYNDDLSAKSLPSLIGFGKSRTSIILTKFVMGIVLNALLYAIFLGGYCLSFILLGNGVTGDMFEILLRAAFNFLLFGIAYMTISSILTYGTQRASIAIVAHVLLAMGLISFLVSKLLVLQFIRNIVGDLSVYLISPILGEVMNASAIGIVKYLIYLTIMITISIICFRKKELEF